MSTEPLDVALGHQFEAGILTLTLQRDAAANALDPTLVEALVAALTAPPPAGLRLIVLRGVGRAFCGGFDLAGLDSQTDGDLLLRFVRIWTLLDAVRHAPVPTLGLAHGSAFGAGADLFAACTWRVAAPGTRFAFPGARFGLVLGMRRLAALVGQQAALDLTLRGRRIDAEAALALGLATEVAPAEAWPGIATTLAAETEPVLSAQDLLRGAVADKDRRDADLADLVRSATRPGLGFRIRTYAEAARAARQDGDRRVRR